MSSVRRWLYDTRTSKVGMRSSRYVLEDVALSFALHYLHFARGPLLTVGWDRSFANVPWQSLSLEPRTYLMLNPLALPGSVPSASAGGSDAQEPAQDRTMALEELKARLRFILPEALEAFGHARLIWGSAAVPYAPRPAKRENASPVAGLDEPMINQYSANLSEDAAPVGAGFEQGVSAEEWYDLCRSQLARMAVGGEALDAIFAGYVGSLFSFLLVRSQRQRRRKKKGWGGEAS